MCYFQTYSVPGILYTVHYPGMVTVVNLAKMVETGAPLRYLFPAITYYQAILRTSV